MKQLFYKIIYHPIINKPLRILNKLCAPLLPHQVKIPPSGTLTFRGEDGKKFLIKSNQTSYLTKLLFWDGYTKFEYTNIFLKLIKKVNVFYDVGANIGYYSLLAEMENPSIKVVAFEPATGPLYYLKENIRINKFKNIHVEDIALSEKSGEITFYEIKNKKYAYLVHNLAGESNAGSKTTHLNFVPTQVKTTTLDEYISYTKQNNLDLVKMDTEGTENKILEHADFVLRQMKPIIICETLFDTIESELESIFKKYGYEFYNHTDGGLKKVESIKRKNDDGIRNCFFVHPEKYPLIEEFVL